MTLESVRQRRAAATRPGVPGSCGRWSSPPARQWIKNLLVFAAGRCRRALPAGGPGPHGRRVRCAFCLASSGMYLLNDVQDRVRDAEHPTKRFRPVAGQLSPRTAVVAGSVLALAAVLTATVAGWPLTAAVGAYLVLCVAYTYRLKDIVLVDVAAVAATFVPGGRRPGGLGLPVQLVPPGGLLRGAVHRGGEALRGVPRARRVPGEPPEDARRLLGAVAALDADELGDGDHHRVLPLGLRGARRAQRAGGAVHPRPSSSPSTATRCGGRRERARRRRSSSSGTGSCRWPASPGSCAPVPGSTWLTTGTFDE